MGSFRTNHAHTPKNAYTSMTVYRSHFCNVHLLFY